MHGFTLALSHSLRLRPGCDRKAYKTGIALELVIANL